MLFNPTAGCFLSISTLDELPKETLTILGAKKKPVVWDFWAAGGVYLSTGLMAPYLSSYCCALTLRTRFRGKWYEKINISAAGLFWVAGSLKMEEGLWQ